MKRFALAWACALFLAGQAAAAPQVGTQNSNGVAITGGTISGADLSGARITATGGSAAATMADRAGDELNLKRDFGAKGDGVTDDTAAIQAFFNACASKPAACFAPAGTYMFTSLTLDTTAQSAGMVIRGAGAGLTIFKRIGGQSGHALTITSGGNYGNMSRPRLQDLTVNGNFSGLDGIHFADVTAAGVYYQAADLRDVTVLDAGQDALYVGQGANAGQTFDFWAAHPNRNGVTINGAVDWRFINSQFYGADQSGFVIKGVADNGAGLIRITTAAPHGLSTGDHAYIWDTNGASGAVGYWTVTVIDSTHVDLQGSSSAGAAWTGGGRFVPSFAVTGVADYGDAGHSIEITTGEPHGYSTGQQVFVKDVGGAYSANGAWTVTVVDATHFILNKSNYQSIGTGAWTGGGTVVAAAFGVYSNSAGGNMFLDDTWYNNQIGLAVSTAASSPFQLRGGELGASWMGGFALQNQGTQAPNEISGVAFNSNSMVASGMFSDIYLCNTGSTQITNNQFDLVGYPSKYLVEAQDIATYGVIWSGNAYRNDGGSQPFASYVSSQASIGIANGRWSFVAGRNNSASNYGSIGLGYGTSSSGQGGLTAGISSNDAGRTAAVFGITAAIHSGGNQVIMAEVLGAKTTNATPTRLLTDWATASAPGAADTYNFNGSISYGTDLYRGCVAMAQKQGVTDRAVWVLPDILMAKDGSNAAVSIVSGTGLLTAGTQTATYATAGMSGVALSITADTVNGGLAVTGTGLAGATIDWHFSCRGAELE